MSTINVSASGIVQDYNRRKISPDSVTPVTQGTLRLWIWCNSYIAELYIGGPDLKPGMVQLTSKTAYMNTMSAQEIADHVCESV